ncbi:MAG: rubredoxin [Acholeplasmatales bacterium]|nr:rubredoxin [Acholeplasmatales bacterium]
MKFVCQVCGYIYDESKEKVPFDELPDDWKCPLCGASKSDFAPMEEETIKEDKKSPNIDYDLVKLNVGEMGALCSNLARACEKQMLKEEQEMFLSLARYFDGIRPLEENAKVIDLLDLLNADIKEYNSLKDFCLDNEDRGAARASVWGDKVTRMLASLVNRYQSEGEKMLKDTDIWVCSVCGFVYIGDNPPELCPVCKVPSWKFERMEGLK